MFECHHTLLFYYFFVLRVNKRYLSIYHITHFLSRQSGLMGPTGMRRNHNSFHIAPRNIQLLLIKVCFLIRDTQQVRFGHHIHF